MKSIDQMNDMERVEILRQYRLLMDEIVVRITWIEQAATGRTGLMGELAREFCFLQLRMICELIGLSCLVAHGDLSEVAKLKNDYRAGQIIKILGRLHPNFFPIPVIRSLEIKNGKRHWTHTAVKDEYMTKDGLITFYGKCGDHLHRGTLSEWLKQEKPLSFGFEDIMQAVSRITTLLDCHEIHMADGKGAMACALKADGDRVSVAYGGKI